MAQRHAITVVPMQLIFGEIALRDGVDIQPAEFYRRLAQSRVLPTTSGPTPEDFLAAFRSAAARGYAEVLCLTLASGLSSTYASALAAVGQAKGELPHLQVTVMDSQTAGGALGLVALAAAEEAERGRTLAAVTAEAQRVAERVYFVGVLDTLYYIWKGGRVPRVAVWATSLLQIKPILDIRHGKVRLVERPRTRRRALERILALVAQHASGQPVKAVVMHADAPGEADALLARLRAAVRCTEVFTTPFTPVIGAHTGPGLLGVAFYPLMESDGDG